ncbi:hypothetical protein BLOT_006066 [Blomia tropicalis]|nr:hypothetical protein BLOT_006066 [Blomia tropicalis]
MSSIWVRSPHRHHRRRRLAVPTTRLGRPRKVIIHFDHVDISQNIITLSNHTFGIFIAILHHKFGMEFE